MGKAARELALGCQPLFLTHYAAITKRDGAMIVVKARLTKRWSEPPPAVHSHLKLTKTVLAVAARAPGGGRSALSRQIVSADPWRFDQPRNAAVFTTRPVMERKEPIVLVTHDVDDEAWQFIGASAETKENAALIALSEAVELDPSVLQLADLPVGWRAVRYSPQDSWKREPHDVA